MLRKIKLAIISAIFVVLSFPNFGYDLLIWGAFVPLFFALEKTSVKQRFIIGYVFGLVMFTGLLYWLFHVSILGAMILLLVLSVFPAIASLYKLSDTPIIVFVVPSVWVITEFIRSHVFTGFPWTLIGHSLYKNIPVIQISDITGAYGVSFLVLMINVAFYSILKMFRNKRYHVFVCVLFSIVTLFYGISFMQIQMEKEPADIAVVQGNIAQEKKWDPQKYEVEILEKYMQLSEDISRKGADIIVWPETSVPGLYENDDSINYRINEMIKRSNSEFLIGSVRFGSGNYYNSAYLISKDGKILQVYDKTHLVPFGEYIPFERSIPWLRGAIDKPVGDMLSGEEYEIFNTAIKTVSQTSQGLVSETIFLKFGVLICFEDIFPGISREAVKKGAQFLFTITNDAWFADTNAPFEHVQSSVFRAIENRVSVVRSANTGVSCFIDPRGEIYEILKVDNKSTFVEGVLSGQIYKPMRMSFYTKFGDVFVWFCALMSLVLIIVDRKQIVRV